MWQSILRQESTEGNVSGFRAYPCVTHSNLKHSRTDGPEPDKSGSGRQPFVRCEHKLPNEIAASKELWILLTSKPAGSIYEKSLEPDRSASDRLLSQIPI